MPIAIKAVYKIDRLFQDYKCTASKTPSKENDLETHQ